MALKPRYVVGEAWSIARTGARQTILAIGLIALSLYVPGLFALVSKNLGRLSAGPDRIVTSDAALARFRRAYPELGAALADLKEAPFPPSLEIRLRPSAPSGSGSALAASARKIPGVESAESEEETGRRFTDALRIVRGAGLLLGGVLVLAAVLSVASAIRLALDLHREEIEIMRLMGATETAVRAPFWLNATAEGLLGGAIALGLLFGTFRLGLMLLARSPHPVLSVFWGTFFDWKGMVIVPLLGAAAGLLGSVLSLGRK